MSKFLLNSGATSDLQQLFTPPKVQVFKSETNWESDSVSMNSSYIILAQTGIWGYCISLCFFLLFFLFLNSWYKAACHQSAWKCQFSAVVTSNNNLGTNVMLH